jgi:Domain of unknown function (DUF4266)
MIKTSSISQKTLLLKERNEMMLRTFLVVSVMVILVLLSGCTAVKPWQRVYLNDPEMQMGASPCQSFGDYVHNIRTGSVAAGSIKSTGGCGCN